MHDATSIVENYKDIVMRKYALFTGRATRSEFWYFVLVNLIISIIVGVFGKFLQSLYSLIVLVPSLAVAVRRLHDIGKSGWWLLLVLIPIIGWIILIVFYATDTEARDNQYGPNPKAATSPAPAPAPVTPPTPEA